MAERLGHDFGRTPFGVRLQLRRDPCTCDRKWLRRDVVDGACPTHGISALLLELVRREKAAAA